MKLPKNMTETEVLATIEKVVNKLAHKFKFGYQDIDDIKQQGRYEALKVLNEGKYNSSFPLENFLSVHISHRLYNYRRDNLKFNESPCLKCPFYDPYFNKSANQCLAFLNKDDCNKWSAWTILSLSKQSLTQPLDITNIDDEKETNMKVDCDIIDCIDKKEIFNKIDNQLDASLRADWLRLRAGISVPKNRKEQIFEEVRRILGICLENADL